jgi:uncharacterized repeat protein (TIGR01451 family)
MTRGSRCVAIAFLLFVSMRISAQTFVFDLRGSQEVPPTPSVHSGGCMGVLDQPGATFSLTCVHDVADATITHIHRAPAGANGGIAFDLGDPSSPITATWTSMTDADIADLLAGNLYVNIHTAGRPAGEIRGQIVPRTVDTVAFDANGSEVVPPNGSSATASCTANLNDAATSIAIQCTHDVPSPVSAHVHEAPAGTNGPEVFTFASAASPLNANMPVTPRLVAAYAATFLYLDIHGPEGTEEDPGVEIRGQIGEPPAAPTTGTIRIVKQTDPAGGTGFHFTENITVEGGFNLDDGQTQTFANVPVGTYTVTEDDPSSSSHTLADIVCDGSATADPFSRTATIPVEGGQVVTCTFRNVRAAPTDEIFVFHLSADQEPAPTGSTARGGCMGRFDAGASSLTLVCTHNVAAATLMHVHRAPAGANGDPVFDMGLPVSPVVTTWTEMTPANVADLFAGNLYVNIHSAGRPAGEIRGQILPRTVDTVAFNADGSQVVPPNDSPSSANCTADLSAAATGLAINCTHTVASPEAAHVHQAPFGENGPIAFTFASPASPLSESMPMTPRLVADFAAQFLYLEIHGPGTSEETATTTIRGQIGVPPAPPTTGTIRIRKTSVPSGGTGFAFDSDIATAPGAFTLDDGQEEEFLDVPAGSYTVTETVPAGYDLTDVSCSDADSVGNPFEAAATVNLEGGETVVCTFTNLLTQAAPETFVFHLSGDQEAPPVASTHRGGCYAQLDAAARELSLVCTHDVELPTLMHIHRAPPGENGDVVFDLGLPDSPVEAFWSGLTDENIADLRAGNLYINVHASGRPSGEIRGQILPRTVDRFLFPVEASQEVPPTDSTETGDCRSDLNDAATSAFIACTHTVPDPTDIHLHAAPPGVDGPAIFDFPLTPSFEGDVPLTPRLVADYAAGFLYVNVHSVDYETGEIRGQLIGTLATTDLAVTKSTAATSVAPGGTLTYTIVVTNNGPNAASDLTLTDALPSALLFQSISAPAGWTCTTPAVGANGTITCTAAALANGASATFTLTTTVDAASGTVTNSATATHPDVDPDPVNSTGTSAPVPIIAPVVVADLSITKTTTATTYVTGDILDYTITVTNAGPDAATNVVVQDVLTGVELVSVAPSQGTCSGTTTATCTLGVLADGATATIALSVRATATSGAILNTATVTATEDANAANNSGSAPAVTAQATSDIPTLGEWALLLMLMALAAAAVGRV